MTSFQDIFCADRDCSSAQFRRALAWKAAPLHGVLTALLTGGSARYFAADRRLLDAVSHAQDMNDIDEALNDYLGDAAGRNWLCTLLGLEVSPWRLKYFARCYLPAGVRSFTSDPFQIFQKLGQ